LKCSNRFPAADFLGARGGSSGKRVNRDLSFNSAVGLYVLEARRRTLLTRREGS
jgi:hypothetical protein